MVTALVADGWENGGETMVPLGYTLRRPVGGLLEWHVLTATVTFGTAPMAFPDLADRERVLLGISGFDGNIKGL